MNREFLMAFKELRETVEKLEKRIEELEKKGSRNGTKRQPNRKHSQE